MKLNVNEVYTTFLDKFSQMYDNFFPIKKIKLKLKDLKRPWITQGIKRSSKRKQRLNNKFWKNKTQKNERLYKDYKTLFEKIIKHFLKQLESAQKPYLSNLINKYKTNIKKIWQVIKEALGNRQVNR